MISSGRFATSVLLSVLLSTAAHAGDFAGFQPIGFSKDGRVFACEEYGIQDGSGFPYSNIFVIDTVEDRYLPGTPVRVRIDDEAAGLGKARAQSLAQAEKLIAENALRDQPGVLVAFNPMTEKTVEPASLSYNQYAIDPMAGGVFTLRIEPVALDVPEFCRDLNPDATGFRLRFTEIASEAADRIVYEDTRIPDSRNCPVSYQLSGVMTYHPRDAEPLHVALVLVRSYGFEGNDGRWIAVPVRP